MANPLMRDATIHPQLTTAIASIPPGRWAIGVSGGADSIALLALLHDRPDLQLHIAHLNHETRGGENEADATLVTNLAKQWNIPCTITKFRELALPNPPRNLPARYRAARQYFFRQVVEANQLQGVMLAHHSDDQAETVLHRLLRGAGPSGLVGIRAKSQIDGLTILHPLSNCPRAQLRDELKRRNLPWREDTSNDSPKYLRNRLRQFLRARPLLTEALLNFATANTSYVEWLDQNAPCLESTFHVNDLRNLPLPLARHAARRWLHEHCGPLDQINTPAINRLLSMALDASTPPRQHFPGNLLVKRSKGLLSPQAHGGSAPC
jgi:tRNA(Ile)-lysidine synthase